MKKEPIIELLDKFEIVNGTFLKTLRRFQIIEMNEFLEDDEYEIGDILEEIFNRPNCFINVSLITRRGTNYNFNYIDVNLRELNKDIEDHNTDVNNEYYSADSMKIYYDHVYYITDSHKQIDSIELKDSSLCDLYKGRAVKKYKSKIKQVARVNEEITELKEFLEIKD